jgi:hypothetical protein
MSLSIGKGGEAEKIIQEFFMQADPKGFPLDPNPGKVEISHFHRISASL